MCKEASIVWMHIKAVRLVGKQKKETWFVQYGIEEISVKDERPMRGASGGAAVLISHPGPRAWELCWV